MIFLIEYDRALGQLVDMRTFANHERVLALQARLEREITLQRMNKRHEVVVLEAANEQDLRATHRRAPGTTAADRQRPRAGSGKTAGPAGGAEALRPATRPALAIRSRRWSRRPRHGQNARTRTRTRTRTRNTIPPDMPSACSSTRINRHIAAPAGISLPMSASPRGIGATSSIRGTWLA